MKLHALAALTLASAFISPSSLSAQQARQDFVLANATGYDVSHVFVSPTKSNEWEEDVLGKDLLEDGDAIADRDMPRSDGARRRSREFRPALHIRASNRDLMIKPPPSGDERTASQTASKGAAVVASVDPMTA
ncbi:MAG: hypothetical protein OEL76_12285 [Siculibacillus sp.]|nr:hypothetical protein [Siculibacillus sp.]